MGLGKHRRLDFFLFTGLFLFANCMWGCGSSDDSTSNGDEDQTEQSENELDETFPECGSGVYRGKYMLPGPGETGFDQDLEDRIMAYERQWHTFNAYPLNISMDCFVDPEASEDRELIRQFIQEQEGWDFEEFAGKKVTDVINRWEKVAGLYGGMGIASDLMRYAVLRDQGADCEEIEVALDHAKKSLDALHLAFELPGVPGVVARGFAAKNFPGNGQDYISRIVPLTDENGSPLPEEKNNGVWREDFSGKHPDIIWEDSCSRDMMSGWAVAAAISMEVIENDPNFSDDLKQRIRDDSHNVIVEFRKIREPWGYDLEFPDADGRTTYHGYLNEHCVERAFYTAEFKNGFHAIMALGIVASFAYASGNPDDQSYLYDELIDKRKLPEIALEDMIYINMFEQTNYSNYSMAFTTAWAALRYINDADALDTIRQAIEIQLYDTPAEIASPVMQQPIEQKQSFFDYVYAYSKTGGNAFTEPTIAPDSGALSRGTETLTKIPEAPLYDFYVENCDEQEQESGDCTLNDGTQVTYLGDVGRKGTIICDKPVPIDIRPTSNYYWRSCPYTPNGGGDGSQMLPAVSFMSAYWMGRWTKVPD